MDEIWSLERMEEVETSFSHITGQRISQETIGKEPHELRVLLCAYIGSDRVYGAEFRDYHRERTCILY